MELPGPDYPAPAKLNLFLHVTGRRPDGYHTLQSVFTLIDRADRLRFRLREDGVIRLVNPAADWPPAEDLAVRAARALQAASGTSLGADIELEKAIPIGGGLGGGSSDAATVLMALDRLWRTEMPGGALCDLGATLGADVPFFLFGRTAWAEGVGERLRPVDIAPAWYVVLVPAVRVPTGAIFAAFELTRASEPLKIEDFSAHPDDPRFHNDLEAIVADRYPAVREHLDWLGRRAKARMTGSGGCVFAPFGRREEAQRVLSELPPSMQGFIARGIGHHPLRAQ